MPGRSRSPPDCSSHLAAAGGSGWSAAEQQTLHQRFGPGFIVTPGPESRCSIGQGQRDFENLVILSFREIPGQFYILFLNPSKRRVHAIFYTHIGTLICMDLAQSINCLGLQLVPVPGKGRMCWPAFHPWTTGQWRGYHSLAVCRVSVHRYPRYPCYPCYPRCPRYPKHTPVTVFVKHEQIEEEKNQFWSKTCEKDWVTNISIFKKTGPSLFQQNNFVNLWI